MTAKDLKPYNVYFVNEFNIGMRTMLIISVNEWYIQYETLYQNQNFNGHISLEDFDRKYQIFNNLTEDHKLK